MEFVLVFAIVFFQMLFINLLKVMEIIRALGVNTFMDNKVFTVFLVNQCMRAVIYLSITLYSEGILKQRFLKNDCCQKVRNDSGIPCKEAGFSFCHHST